MLYGSLNKPNRKPHGGRESEICQEPSFCSHPSRGTAHVTEAANILLHPAGPLHDSSPSCNFTGTARDLSAEPGQPIRQDEIINHCLKQPSFGVVCCVEIDHWSTWMLCDLRQVKFLLLNYLIDKMGIVTVLYLVRLLILALNKTLSLFGLQNSYA